jgi:hypothetical protein
MLERTYINKFATIIKDSSNNTGINPVAEVCYGRNVSRILCQFDTDKIKCLVDNKTFPDKSKLRHILKITNAGSIDMSDLHNRHYSSNDAGTHPRATSFDLIFFLIPDEWDRGKGYDFSKTFFNKDFYSANEISADRYLSTDGVSWFQSRNGYNWKTDNFTQKTTDKYADFNVDIDKLEISSNGDEITVKYNLVVNNIYMNQYGEIEELTDEKDRDYTIYDSVYYDRLGNICYDDINIQKKAASVETKIKFNKNQNTEERKFSFRVKCEIDGKTYESAKFTIIQYGSGELVYPKTADGIYSNSTLSAEYDKFAAGEESIIIGRQHFDIGNENIELDITSIFNKMMDGEIKNNGIGIAYSPLLENSSADGDEEYTGFLTDKTNTFFAPFIETIYDDAIDDDRANFVLDKNNRLYLYCSFGGNLDNLDALPTCTINEQQYDVKQYSKGIYYIDITLPSSAFTAPIMLYDTWGGIIYQGNKLDDVELDFTVQDKKNYFNIGTGLPSAIGFTPSVSGVKDDEEIKRGDIRKIAITAKVNYKTNTSMNINSMEARLYVKDGEAENDIIPFMKVNRTFLENYFILDTNMLIPQKYYIDVRISYGMQSIIHHDVTHFKIVDDIDNKYA